MHLVHSNLRDTGISLNRAPIFASIQIEKIQYLYLRNLLPVSLIFTYLCILETKYVKIHGWLLIKQFIGKIQYFIPIIIVQRELGANTIL